MSLSKKQKVKLCMESGVVNSGVLMEIYRSEQEQIDNMLSTNSLSGLFLWIRLSVVVIRALNELSPPIVSFLDPPEL